MSVSYVFTQGYVSQSQRIDSLLFCFFNVGLHVGHSGRLRKPEIINERWFGSYLEMDQLSTLECSYKCIVTDVCLGFVFHTSGFCSLLAYRWVDGVVPVQNFSESNYFLLTGKYSNMFMWCLAFICFDEKGLSYMTQSPVPAQKNVWICYTKMSRKTVLTQRLRTVLGRSVGLPAPTQLVLLTEFRGSNLPISSQQPC